MKRCRDTECASGDERPRTEFSEPSFILIEDSEDHITAVSGGGGTDDAEVQSPTAHPVELFLLSVRRAGSDLVDRWGTPTPLAVAALKKTPLLSRIVEAITQSHVGATPWVVRIDLTHTFPEIEDSRSSPVFRQERDALTDDALEDELKDLELSASRCVGTIVGTFDVYMKVRGGSVLSPANCADRPPAAIFDVTDATDL